MFNQIWLEALEPVTIKGREVAVGERFQMSRTKSGALLVLGQARIAKPPQKPPDPEPVPTPRRRGRPRKTETTEAPTRQYRRRDLEAEP